MQSLEEQDSVNLVGELQAERSVPNDPRKAL